MPEQVTHPSPTDLHAYGLGQLPPDEATAIERHISECEPCCETIADLSSADTFIELLQSAEEEPNAQTVDHQLGSTTQNSAGVPEPLAEHSRYEIARLIGKGGMGDVYEARHRMMERTVALKIIKQELMRKPEAVDRFHREVKAAAQLAHPNVVTAHDAEQAGNNHFMVMEFVDGVDLSQMVKDQGALPVADACAYICQAATGLQHAHECGMVHRDIKPHNLMVTANGTVKILDFGLASLSPEKTANRDAVEARSDLTAAGAIMGTPDFISPEQAEDARQADIRSDIYSLGATLYYLLSGRVPFADGSVMHKLKSHAQIEPDSLHSLRDDVPAELVAIVAKMMAKNSDERYQTPAEVADAVSSVKVAAAGGAVPSKSKAQTARPAFLAVTLRRVLSSLAVTIPCALALGLLSVKGCGDSAQETQNAYTDLSSYLQSGRKTTHNTYSVNALHVLTDTSEGRKLLAKIDADSEKLSFVNFEDFGAKHAIDWAAALIHDDRVNPRQRELTVTAQHENGSYGPTGSVPSQIHLESVRITMGGGFSGPKLVIGFTASDRPEDLRVVQETLQLTPGTRYEVDVDLVDVIDGSIDWIDLWQSGTEKALEVFIKVSEGSYWGGTSQWDITGGFFYLKQDKPGVMYSLAESPEGKRVLNYVVLIRHNVEDGVQARASGGKLTNYLTHASVGDNITIDGKSIDLQFDMWMDNRHITSETFTLNGQAVDLSKGKLFLVDWTDKGEEWTQLDATFPMVLPSPKAVTENSILAENLALELMDQLTAETPQSVAHSWTREAAR